MELEFGGHYDVLLTATAVVFVTALSPSADAGSTCAWPDGAACDQRDGLPMCPGTRDPELTQLVAESPV